MLQSQTVCHWSQLYEHIALWLWYGPHTHIKMTVYLPPTVMYVMDWGAWPDGVTGGEKGAVHGTGLRHPPRVNPAGYHPRAGCVTCNTCSSCYKRFPSCNCQSTQCTQLAQYTRSPTRTHAHPSRTDSFLSHPPSLHLAPFPSACITPLRGHVSAVNPPCGGVWCLWVLTCGPRAHLVCGHGAQPICCCADDSPCAR